MRTLLRYVVVDFPATPPLDWELCALGSFPFVLSLLGFLPFALVPFPSFFPFLLPSLPHFKNHASLHNPLQGTQQG